MDPFTLLASLATAGGSLIGGLGANAASGQSNALAQGMNAFELQNSWDRTHWENVDARNFNRDQSQVTREWAQNQTAKQDDWASGEAQKARDQQNQQFWYSQSFNATEAQKQRDFENQMSSTAYQRATSDMKKAGINPMLAYMQGGASTPSGASASSSGTGAAQASGSAVSGGPQASSSAPSFSPGGGNHGVTFRNALGDAFSSGVQAYTASKDAERADAQIANIQQQTRTERENTRRAGNEADASRYLSNQRIADIDKTAADAGRSRSAGQLDDTENARRKTFGGDSLTSPSFWGAAAGDMMGTVQNLVPGSAKQAGGIATLREGFGIGNYSPSSSPSNSGSPNPGTSPSPTPSSSAKEENSSRQLDTGIKARLNRELQDLMRNTYHTH